MPLLSVAFLTWLALAPLSGRMFSVFSGALKLSKLNLENYSFFQKTMGIPPSQVTERGGPL